LPFKLILEQNYKLDWPECYSNKTGEQRENFL
jgi:hypothetical protein